MFPGGKVWGRLGSLAPALIWEDVGPHYFWGIPILKKSIWVHQNEIQMYPLSCIFSGNPSRAGIDRGVEWSALSLWCSLSTWRMEGNYRKRRQNFRPCWKPVPADRTMAGQSLRKGPSGRRGVSADSPTQWGYRLAPRQPRALHCPMEWRVLNTNWHHSFLSILADGNLLGVGVDIFCSLEATLHPYLSRST